MTTVGTKNKTVRNAWIEKTLKSLPEGLRILDAGAGEQAYKSSCQHLQYVAQDFGEYDGKGDNTGLQTGKWNYEKLNIVCDITKIPEEDSSFDVVMCTEVFEHLPEPVKAIKEFHRLLKNDGILILTAPFCSLTHFAPYHYYSGYNRYFYETVLRENGFHLLELVPNGNYFEYIAQEIRRLPQVAKDFCNVQTGRWFMTALRIMLKWLERFSNDDHGSDKILCYGYFVRALKIEK